MTFLNSSGNPISNQLILNLNKTNLNYQFVGIALNSVTFTSNLIRSVEFKYIKTQGATVHLGYFLDIIKLEGGINPPITVSSFLNLSDTPSSYSGQGGKVVAVKADLSGLEFVTGGGGSKWTDVGSNIRRNSQVLIAPAAVAFADAGANLEVIGRVNISNVNNCTHIGFGAGSGETSGSANVSLGRNAGALNNIGFQNTILGWVAGYSNTGNDNTFIGRQAAWLKVSGNNNVGIGSASMISATSGDNNVAVGYGSLFSAVAPVNQTAIGFQALLLDNNGTENTALGSRVFENLRNSVNNKRNIGIGFFVAQANLTMENSIFIGFNTRPAANGQINQIVIGDNQIGNGSNSTVIGNSLTTNSYIFGTLRVGTFSNAVGNFITKSATGILQERTPLESSDDILKSISGYSASITQTLTHNASGIIQWT